jgi:hypothetical protein
MASMEYDLDPELMKSLYPVGTTLAIVEAGTPETLLVSLEVFDPVTSAPH